MDPKRPCGGLREPTMDPKRPCGGLPEPIMDPKRPCGGIPEPMNAAEQPRTLSGRTRNTLGLLQGTFWFATGVWPFLSRRSFERVTGPKTDWWLVQTVGGLVGVIGGALVLAAARRRVTPEIRLLASSGAIFLAGIDVYYAARRRISPVYLADAAVEVALATAWALPTGSQTIRAQE